jgi:hypothetical protein
VTREIFHFIIEEMRGIFEFMESWMKYYRTKPKCNLKNLAKNCWVLLNHRGICLSQNFISNHTGEIDASHYSLSIFMKGSSMCAMMHLEVYTLFGKKKDSLHLNCPFYS